VALVGVGTPRLRQIREHCRALAGGVSVMGGPGVCDEKRSGLRSVVRSGILVGAGQESSAEALSASLLVSLIVLFLIAADKTVTN
jgi:hypothetical protein